MNNNIWHVIEVILFALLIVSFFLLSDDTAAIYFSASVIFFNIVYSVIYVIHLRKTKNFIY